MRRWHRLWSLMLALLCVMALGSAHFASAQVAGGRLVVATSQDPITLNPAMSAHLHSHMIADSMFSLLVRRSWDPQEFLPDLAESWKISNEGRTFTFHLRDDVLWHDGEPFTSADVKFTFEEVIQPLHPSGLLLFGDLIEVETPDPYTAVFQFSTPQPAFLEWISLYYYGSIIPKHVYEGESILDHPANFKPVGTGPFKFAEYVRGSHVRVVRNENYYRPGLPYLDEIVFRIIPDSSAALAALQTGEVHYIAWNIPRHVVARLERIPGIVVDTSKPSITVTTLWTRINTSRPYLNDVRVRQALEYATDRQELLEKAFFGQGQVAYSFINPENPTHAWAANPNMPRYTYDPEKAEQLLDEAGYPRDSRGIRFTISQTTSASDIEANLANEILREQWARVGIELRLEPLEGTAFAPIVYGQYNFDMAMGLWSFGPDPSLVATHLHGKQIRPGVSPSNISHYNSERANELMDRAAATIDREERAAAFRELQEVLAEDVPGMWFVHANPIFVYRNELGGLPIPPLGYMGHYDEVHFVK